MVARLSTALRNEINAGGSVQRILSNCVLKVYSGAQPASADAAPTGILLCPYSLSSGALIREVLGTGSITLSGTAGTVDTFKIASPGPGTAFDIAGIGSPEANIANDGTAAGTATLVAAAVNNYPGNALLTASTTGATGVITLTEKRGMGSLLATWVPSGTGTTTSFGTVVNIGSGVAGVKPVNGLRWTYPSALGVLSKLASQTWSGVAAASGTAGWFRIEAAVTDSLALDSTYIYPRLDGAVATSGAELNLSTLAMTSGATQTIDTFTITLPTA